MAKFIVVHGTFNPGKNAIGHGGSIELSPEEKAHLDPDGNKLVTPDVFDAMQKKAAASAVVEAAKAPAKAPEPKAAPKKDGGK
jgi:hypothetical protein